MDEDNEGGLYLSCNLCARPLSRMYKCVRLGAGGEGLGHRLREGCGRRDC